MLLANIIAIANIQLLVAIDIITVTGIGNGSISHDLYVRNLCAWKNPLKNIRVMPLPTSCFRVGSLLV